MFNLNQAVHMRRFVKDELPHVQELTPLYEAGVNFTRGQIIMIAGRNGSQKSGFTMWLMSKFEQPTLYISSDMSSQTVVSRMGALAATGHKTNHVVFAPLSPISWQDVGDVIEAWVELWDTYPAHIVIDNLQDFQGASHGYKEQMEEMSSIAAMARDLGSNVWIMHHASDRSMRGNTDEGDNAAALPPPRWDIKNGLGEKPEVVLGVALDPREVADGMHNFNIAVLKDREGASDPTGQTFVTLICEPGQTRFYGGIGDEQLDTASVAIGGVGSAVAHLPGGGPGPEPIGGGGGDAEYSGAPF